MFTWTRKSLSISNNILTDILPISRAQLWKCVDSGRLPQPIRLSERVRIWHVATVLNLLDSAMVDYETYSITTHSFVPIDDISKFHIKITPEYIRLGITAGLFPKSDLTIDGNLHWDTKKLKAWLDDMNPVNSDNKYYSAAMAAHKLSVAEWQFLKLSKRIGVKPIKLGSSWVAWNGGNIAKCLAAIEKHKASIKKIFDT